MEKDEGMPKTQPKNVVSVVEGDSKVESQGDSKSKTYTEEEVEAKFSQQRSVLDKKIADKDREIASYAAREDGLTAREKKFNEAEEYELRDKPEELTSLRAKRQAESDDTANKTELTNRETKVAQRETELDEIIKRDGTRKRTELAAEVAQDNGVSADSILKGAKDDSREAMEAIAELLPKVDPLPVLISHNSRTSIGSNNWRDLSADEKINYALANPKK